MKKTLSLILCISFILGISAYGAESTLSDLYLNNATVDFEISAKPYESLEIINTLDKYGYFDEINAYVDISSLLESLFSAKSEGTIKIHIPKDSKKILLSFLSDAAGDLTVNENLGFSYNAKSAYFLDADCGENPYLNFIYTGPVARKYMVADTRALPGFPEEIKTALSILSPESLEALQKKSYELMEACGEVKKSKNNYTVTFNDSQFKNYIIEVLKLADTKTTDNETYLDLVSELEELFKYVNILGKDGYEAKFTLSSGMLKKCESEIDILINFYELLEAGLAEIPEEITRENSSFGFKMKITEVYSDIGTTEVTLPELNEKNSVNLFENYTEPEFPEITYEEEEEEFTRPYAVSGCFTKVLYENRKEYMPLRSFLETCFPEEEYEISYKNGKVSARLMDYNVEINLNSRYITLNGKKTEGYVILKDGVTYLDAKAFENAFDYTLTEITKTYNPVEYYYLFIDKTAEE